MSNQNKLNEFMNKTVKKEWTYCEQYMLINNNKIEEKFPNGKSFTSENSNTHYVNGTLVYKNNEYIFFITYTYFDNKCVFNHISRHTTNGEILSLLMNCFYDGVIDGLDLGGKEYVEEMLENLLKKVNKGKFKWDIIE